MLEVSISKNVDVTKEDNEGNGEEEIIKEIIQKFSRAKE